MENSGEVILVKEGELFLKGQNKINFENKLIKNIKQNLKSLGKFEIKKSQSTITIKPLEPCNLEAIKLNLSKVFGIVDFCFAAIIEKDFDKIKLKAKDYLKPILLNNKTFKVEAKRSDKKFSLNSFQLCCKLGEFLLENFPNLKVDVKKPDVRVKLEIRDDWAYLYSKNFKGAGGVPTGTSGEALALISGGIDSPVSAYLMAKRGLKLHAVHFHSPPYTSNRALKKVKNLALKLCDWLDHIPLYIVNFTKIQEEIKKSYPNNLNTIIGRRAMMKISERIALSQNSKGFSSIKALITGESLGQVASQTLEALGCTNKACSFPVFRPLIGMDKAEIIKIAQKIETFETSILPFEDCCSVFTPKHPKTKPNLLEIKELEEKFKLDDLINNALNSMDFILVKKS